MLVWGKYLSRYQFHLSCVMKKVFSIVVNPLQRHTRYQSTVYLFLCVSVKRMCQCHKVVLHTFCFYTIGHKYLAYFLFVCCLYMFLICTYYWQPGIFYFLLEEGNIFFFFWEGEGQNVIAYSLLKQFFTI